MTDDPLSKPGVKVMVAWPLPDTIESIVGATGVPGVTEALSETAPVPLVFIALSAMRYAVPLLSPVIVTGLVKPAGSKAV